jgi:hypothetical protein
VNLKIAICFKVLDQAGINPRPYKLAIYQQNCDFYLICVFVGLSHLNFWSPAA